MNLLRQARLDNVKTKNVPYKLTPQAIADLFPLEEKVPQPQTLTEESTPPIPRTKDTD